MMTAVSEPSNSEVVELGRKKQRIAKMVLTKRCNTVLQPENPTKEYLKMAISDINSKYDDVKFFQMNILLGLCNFSSVGGEAIEGELEQQSEKDDEYNNKIIQALADIQIKHDEIAAELSARLPNTRLHRPEVFLTFN